MRHYNEENLASATFCLAPTGDGQGLTLIFLSAQCKRFWWDKGYSGGV
jgi:hypothetical protein